MKSIYHVCLHRVCVCNLAQYPLSHFLVFTKLRKKGEKHIWSFVSREMKSSEAHIFSSH